MNNIFEQKEINKKRVCFIGKKYSVFYYCRRNQQLKLMFHEYKCGQLMMSCFVLFNETPTGLIHRLVFFIDMQPLRGFEIKCGGERKLAKSDNQSWHFYALQIKSRPKKCMGCRKTRPKKCVVFSKSRPKKCKISD